MKLYDAIVDWYDLVDPVADHRDEAASYGDALIEALRGTVAAPRPTLLELGAGAGNNAFFLKERFACTLTDPAEAMLAWSREQNPECEHRVGDMRTLRLGRTFDAVFIHDAIVYMTTTDDLRAALRTAWEHTRPGGAAVFAPDDVAETFEEGAILLESDQGDRAMRGVEWCFDPDPGDTTYVADYGLLLRRATETRMVHDRHVEGLFPRATWIALLRDVGWEVAIAGRALGPDERGEMFVARRPP